MTTYARTRPRGLAPWRPQRKTRALLAQIEAVLDEYEEHLPLTLRQLFYRLVGAHGYSKTERAYGRLGETLNRARRAGLVPFEAIRDDGPTQRQPSGFHGLSDFWRAVRDAAEGYRRDRREGQPAALELWCEAAGMLPQLARVADTYGIPVYSSGGFDSLTTKHAAANRILDRKRPTVVLHVGDLDPSGVSIFDAFAEDVRAFVADLAPWQAAPEFVRVAVTREQVERYALPEAPAKRTDKRGDWRGGTVQAEALAPPDLATEVRGAIETRIDPVAYARIVAVERRERDELVAELESRS